MEPRRALRRAVERKEFVRITRRGPGLRNVHGFPLAVGRSLVLVREITDFDVLAVGIHQFDATAVWDREPTEVLYEDVTQVRFDERYTRVFARYLGDIPPL